MRLKIKQLSPALAVAAVLVAVPATGASASTASPLPQLTSFDKMVVDSSAGHIFMSQGTTGNGIVVTDLSGTYQTTLDSSDHVDGLAISSDGSTLYAAVTEGADVGKVAKISVPSITSTLSQTFYSLGTSDAPYSLALQSGKLWVSYNHSGTINTGAIGTIDPGTGTFTANAAGGSFYSAPILAADPQDTGILVAGTQGLSPAPVTTFNVATTPVTTLAQTRSLTGGGGSDLCDNLLDLAVVPGGTQFIPACGAPYSESAFSTATLQLQTTYPADPYPSAVAIAAKGTVAAGTSTGINPAIYVYSPDSASALNTFQLTNSLRPGGLAWSADGSTLYAVVRNGSSYSLNVYDKAAIAQSTLNLSGPSTAYSGHKVTLTGTLKAAGAGVAGAHVTVSRTESGNTVTLPAVTTASDGSFTVADTPLSPGTYTYTVNYAGDTTTASASASHGVTVSQVGSILTLRAPGKILIARRYTVTGKLMLSTGIPPTGTVVKITRTKPGATTMHWTRKTAADGTFTLSNKPPAVGTYTYTAAYAGDSTTAAATVTRKVRVIKRTVSLRIATNRNKIRYRGSVKVTAHLGHTYRNRTVAIYARTVGSKKKVLLKRGHVNSHGYLTLWYRRAPHSKVFSAVFTGDPHYRARTVSHTVGVWVKVAAKYTGYYTTASHGGRKWHFYHHTALLKTRIHVTPNKHGQCVKLQTQEFYNGSWHANVVTNCGHLNRYSTTSDYLILTNADRGYPYRVRAVYVRKSGDHSNLNTLGSWFYLVVRK